MSSQRQIYLRMTAPARGALDAFLNGPWNKTTVAFGGCRYLSKTHMGAQALGFACLLNPNTKFVCLRRVLKDTDLNLGEEIRKGFMEAHGFPMGTVRRNQIAYNVNDKNFKFPNGSLLQLGFCNKPDDYLQFVGTQWDGVWFEQAEQFPRKVREQVGGSVRPSTNSSGWQPRKLITFNPGGPYQDDIYQDIVDPATRGRDVVFFEGDLDHSYATLERDPGYVLRELMTISDPVLRAQWRAGNWDARQGTYFRLKPDTVREVKIPIEIANWYGGEDWGRAAPFVHLMMAHWTDRASPFDRHGKVRVHVKKEVYHRNLDQDEQAEMAIKAEDALRREYPNMRDFSMRFADPAVYAKLPKMSDEATRTTALMWAECGFHVYPAHPDSRVARWELIKYLINNGNLTIDPECRNLIREFKSAIYKDESEDLDQKKCDDHALDALSYVVGYLYGLGFKNREMSKEEQLKEKMRQSSPLRLISVA